jgi:hypothetical protein
VAQSHDFLQTLQHTMCTVVGSGRGGGITRSRHALVRQRGEQYRESRRRGAGMGPPHCSQETPPTLRKVHARIQMWKMVLRACNCRDMDGYPLPWVYRPVEGRVQTKMPYGGSNRSWLHAHLGERIRPDYEGNGVWAIARNHLQDLVDGLAGRFGRVDVILDFRTTERCDTRCRDARGDECTCSCLGENHGGAAYWRYWIEVGGTTLVAGGEIRRRHMRLLRS